jgi:DNA/RNA-binding protein KIN17
MCQKQCRDENGFKCHTMSEGHLRQMRLFAQNPNQILSSFSQEFEKGFLKILSHSHGTKRVFANRVYQEYIGDKDHVHMNSTAWTTLTGFCKYLGKEGKCIVDETEKGWFVQYVDRDPEALAKQAARDERKQTDLSEEEINKRMIENQIRYAFEKQKEKEVAQEENEDEDEDSEEAKVHKPIHVKFTANNNESRKRSSMKAFSAVDDEDGEGEKATMTVGKVLHYGRKSGSAIEQLIQEEEKRKKFKSSEPVVPQKEVPADLAPLSGEMEEPDTWLSEGILVKVVSKKIYDGEFYKLKGTVLDVRKNGSKCEAEVLFKDFNNKLGSEAKKTFQEAELETVVPKVTK